MRPGAPQQHCQPIADPSSPDSTYPKISAFSNVTISSSRSNTLKTLDRKTSCAPCRNSTKASAPSFKEPPLPSTILLGVGGTIYNNHTLEPFKELGLDSQRVKKLASKLHVHSVNYAAKLVHSRRALSSTIYYQLSSGDGLRSSLHPH